jgi:nucleoside-diphosphate-sugar epimerase
LAKNNLSSPPKELENCVLIVGGSGFIGRALCDQLTSTGLNVVSTSRSPSKHVTPYQQVILDVFNEKNRIEVLERFKPKTVVFLAWETTHLAYWESSLNIKYMESALKFAEESYKFKVSKFVGIGSMSEYGFSPGSCSSTKNRVNPQDLYSLSKCHTSNELIKIAKKYELEANWVRLFHPYGVGEKELRLIPRLINNMVDGKDIEILNPKHKLDFTHVIDVAHAINLIICNTFPYVTDVGTGIPTSVESVVKILANHLNFPEHKIKYYSSDKSVERNIYVEPSSYLHTANWHPSKKLNEHLIDYANFVALFKNT